MNPESPRKQFRLLAEIKPKITFSRVLLLTGLFFGIYFLLPQVGQIKTALLTLPSANLFWVAVSLIFAIANFFVLAYILQVTLQTPIDFGRRFRAQLATTFVNKLSPVGVGGTALQIKFLGFYGIPRKRALFAATLPAVMVTIFAFFITILVSPAAAGRIIGQAHFSFGPEILLFLQVLAASGVVALFFLPIYQEKVKEFFYAVAEGFRASVTFTSFLRLVLATALIFLVNLAGYYASALAFHITLPLGVLVTSYMAGAVAGQVAPTPGGLGAQEAAMVAALAVFGAETPTAIASVLLFRLITFWLPLPPGYLAFRNLQRRELA